MSLLAPADRPLVSGEFNFEGLLRGNTTARKDFFVAMVSNGIYTRDECRLKDNLEPKGGNADVLTVQSAMVDIANMSTTGSNAATQAAQGAAKTHDALLDWLADDVRSIRAKLATTAQSPPLVINNQLPRVAVQPQDVYLTVKQPEPAPKTITTLVPHRDPETGLVARYDVIHNPRTEES
jgi:hypothetical protein